MQPVSFKRHRFPPEVIRLAVWLYFRFTLSLRDVEEMLAQRGIEVSYETIRCWALKFGRAFARNLRRARHKPTGRWHLDEMDVKIRGERMWLWRAVDDGSESNSGSSLNVQRKGFSQLTPPSTTTSTFKDT
jgi:transposase-like protein